MSSSSSGELSRLFAADTRSGSRERCKNAGHDRIGAVLLRPDVPVRLPDLGLDPRRARAGRARHHLAVLLARGGEPRRGQEAPVGTAVVVRLGPDAGRLADPPRAGQRRARPLVRGRRLGVLQRRREDARARGARRGAAAPTASTRRSSSARSPIPRRSTTCAPTTITPRVDATARTACRRSCSSRATRSYGPVVVPAPTGDDAVALWDLVRSMQRFPHLYELRHPKTHDDLVHVAEQFETYLTTRDWNTVENPAP